VRDRVTLLGSVGAPSERTRKWLGMADVGVRGVLMTDLEGSTAHLRTLGDDYGRFLARHHEIIRAAISSEGGVEVGSEGDSFAAVFSGSAAALLAAVEAQRGFVDEEWPDSPWRVRMAVHAGVVELRASDAVGLALHETARLRGVVHGGQIVVSEPARSTIDAVLPAIEFVDLGLHSVRDFASPLRLYQVQATGLPATFPALRTMVARPVPVARTTFIGRSAEIAELLEALNDSRLVTIAAAGGGGKTRLAYEVARSADHDAVVVVELAGVREGPQVQAEVAAAFGARDPDLIADAVGAQEVLVVIDNCEHVLADVAPYISALIDKCPGLTVLATSREPLGVAGELVWSLPPLEPDDAVRLFCARAPVVPEKEHVSEVCERLAGMPLAIELAAARLRSMSWDDLITRLDDQLRVLTTGTRDTPRHQTLRAALDWSHDLLSVEERTGFRRLSVFAGGFTLAAAEAVAGDAGTNVLDAIDGLVQKSLVERSAERSRYGMLEPVRQYAAEQLLLASETEPVHTAHMLWVSTLTREANRNLFRDQRRWTASLDAERDNIGAAIGWALDHNRRSIAVAIVSHLAWYWFTSGRNDSLVWVPRVLEHIDDYEPADRARALLAAGITHCDSITDPRPIEWLNEATQIFRELDHERALDSALWWLGRAAAMRDDDATAERAFNEALPLQERLGDLFGWGWSLLWIAGFTSRRGQIDDAEEIVRDVIARCESVPHVVAAAWYSLAQLAYRRGDFATANDYVCYSIELFGDLGDRWQVAINTEGRARFTLEIAPDIAAHCVIEAIQAFRDLGDDPDLERTLRLAAYVLLRANQPREAATLIGASHRMISTELKALDLWNREMLESLTSILQDPSWKVEVERGRRLGLRDAADAATNWLKRAYPTEP
jgi:predicted ATPase/class 3 adenylate cyclase